MSIAEGNAFRRLKQRICRPEDRFERVENGLMAGMLDVNYCMFGSEGWIEIKCPTVPKRKETGLFASGHPVTQEQSNWFLRQMRAGGRAFLFIATPQCLLLIGAELAEKNAKVNSMSLDQLCDAALWKSVIPVEVVDWIQLRGILVGRK